MSLENIENIDCDDWIEGIYLFQAPDSDEEEIKFENEECEQKTYLEKEINLATDMGPKHDRRCRCKSQKQCSMDMTHCLENKKRISTLERFEEPHDRNFKYNGEAYVCMECYGVGPRESFFEDSFKNGLQTGEFICHLCKMVADTDL